MQPKKFDFFGLTVAASTKLFYWITLYLDCLLILLCLLLRSIPVYHVRWYTTTHFTASVIGFFFLTLADIYHEKLDSRFCQRWGKLCWNVPNVVLSIKIYHDAIMWYIKKCIWSGKFQLEILRNALNESEITIGIWLHQMVWPWCNQRIMHNFVSKCIFP